MMTGIKEYDENDATSMRNFQRSYKALFDRFTDFNDADKLVMIRSKLGPKSLARFDRFMEGGPRSYAEWLHWFLNNSMLQDDSRTASAELRVISLLWMASTTV